MDPRVSVIIPAFNAERFLAQALDSVRAQTYADFEVIVVDDGSDDRTAEVAHHHPLAVRYIRQANRGEAAARNTGIRAARGEVVALLDADDVWSPDYLGRQIDVLDATEDGALVFSDAYVWHERQPLDMTLASRSPLRFDPADPGVSIVRGFIILPSAVVLPRGLLLASGLFNERLVFGVDVSLWLRLVLMGVQFVYNDAPLVLYRYHSGSLSNTLRWARTQDLGRALARLQGNPALPPQIRAAAAERARGLPRRFAWLATDALVAGEIREARACWTSAFAANPWNPVYALGAALTRTMPYGAHRLAVWLQRVRTA